MSSHAIPDEILGTLLHELKTPIAVIVGYAELVESRSTEATTREAARHIRQAAEELRSRVDRLPAELASQ